MKTILMMLVLVGCGDDAATSGGPDGSVDGSVDGDGSVTPPDGRTDDSLSPQPMIPGGTFLRSFDNVTFMDNGYPATVSSFTLDKYEATVARFRVFAASTALPTAPLKCSSGSFQGTWTDAAGANESMPINCITWAEASAFCAWDGGRLPTEAEWNYAAAGGSEQRVYPWSSPPTSTTLDQTYASYGALTPVGSKPLGDGRWGHSDLAGNVAEWTLDWYADPYTNPCVDCANLTPTTARSQRGGGVSGGPPSALLASARRAAVPTNRSAAIGVRCAR